MLKINRTPNIATLGLKGTPGDWSFVFEWHGDDFKNIPILKTHSFLSYFKLNKLYNPAGFGYYFNDAALRLIDYNRIDVKIENANYEHVFVVATQQPLFRLQFHLVFPNNRHRNKFWWVFVMPHLLRQMFIPRLTKI